MLKRIQSRSQAALAGEEHGETLLSRYMSRMHERLLVTSGSLQTDDDCQRVHSHVNMTESTECFQRALNVLRRLGSMSSNSCTVMMMMMKIDVLPAVAPPVQECPRRCGGLKSFGMSWRRLKRRWRWCWPSPEVPLLAASARLRSPSWRRTVRWKQLPPAVCGVTHQAGWSVSPHTHLLMCLLASALHLDRQRDELVAGTWGQVLLPDITWPQVSTAEGRAGKLTSNQNGCCVNYGMSTSCFPIVLTGECHQKHNQKLLPPLQQRTLPPRGDLGPHRGNIFTLESGVEVTKKKIKVSAARHPVSTQDCARLRPTFLLYNIPTVRPRSHLHPFPLMEKTRSTRWVPWLKLWREGESIGPTVCFPCLQYHGIMGMQHEAGPTLPRRSRKGNQRLFSRSGQKVAPLAVIKSQPRRNKNKQRRKLNHLKKNVSRICFVCLLPFLLSNSMSIFKVKFEFFFCVRQFAFQYFWKKCKKIKY